MNEKNALEALHQTFLGTTDLGSRSDELATANLPWPVIRRVARGRVDPLRMLSLREGDRVLVVDSGDGTWTRYALEQGAFVCALVPNGQAEATLKLRTQGQFDLEICRQSRMVPWLQGGFSWILVPPECSPELWSWPWDNFKTLLLPQGQFFGAFDNPLSLAHILGLMDSPGRQGSTQNGSSHQSISHQLSSLGLSHQQWYYAYPEVEQPSVVLNESFWTLGDLELSNDLVDLVDQIVRNPLNLAGPKPPLGYDVRLLHRMMVKEGMGPAVSGGFFVMAGVNSCEKPSETSPLVWLFGADRLNCWRRMRLLRQGEKSNLLLEDPKAKETASVDWIRQRRTGLASWHLGKTLEQMALEACRSVNRATLKMVLEKWLSTICENLLPGDGTLLDRRVSPGYLDVELSNFVFQESGEIYYIDEEWVLTDSPTLRLVTTRALTSFALLLVQSGLVAFWGRQATVQEVASSLAALVGLEIESRDFEAARSFEAKLVNLVQGGVEAVHLRELEVAADRRVWKTVIEPRDLPEDVQILHKELNSLRVELEDVYADRDRLQADTEILQRELEKVSTLYWVEKEKQEDCTNRPAKDSEADSSKLSFWHRILKKHIAR